MKSNQAFPIELFNEVALASGRSDFFNQEGYRHADFDLIATNRGGTITFFHSMQAEKPNLAEPASLTNRYYPVAVVNLKNSNISEQISIPLAVLTLESYEINSNGLKWIGAKYTKTAGTGTLTMNGNLFDNQ